MEKDRSKLYLIIQNNIIITDLLLLLVLFRDELYYGYFVWFWHVKQLCFNNPLKVPTLQCLSNDNPRLVEKITDRVTAVLKKLAVTLHKCQSSLKLEKYCLVVISIRDSVYVTYNCWKWVTRRTKRFDKTMAYLKTSLQQSVHRSWYHHQRTIGGEFLTSHP